MYVITNYTKQKARELNVTVTLSKHTNKKLDVYKNGRYIVSVGDTRYMDYPTFKIKYGALYADKKRRLYKMRHEKDRHRVGTAGYYADQLLW